MRKLKRNLSNAITGKYIYAGIKAKIIAEAAYDKLMDDSGNFMEEALKYIIGIVVGGLFLAGIYALIKNVVMPALGDKTEDMFNYSA